MGKTTSILIIILIFILVLSSLVLAGFIIFDSKSSKVDIHEIECDCNDEEERWQKMLNTAVSNVGQVCTLASNKKDSANAMPIMPVPPLLTVPNERSSKAIKEKKPTTTLRSSNNEFFSQFN